MRTSEEAWNSAMEIANRIRELAEGRESDDVLIALAFVLAQILKQTTSNEAEVKAQMEKFVTAAVKALDIMLDRAGGLNS
jgi:aryl-alcohol dehydrogenase-like predicted oxidoreductase